MQDVCKFVVAEVSIFLSFQSLRLTKIKVNQELGIIDSPSKRPVSYIRLHFLHFGSRGFEIIHSNILNRFSIEELCEHFVRPLFVLLTSCGMPPIQTIELKHGKNLEFAGKR